MKQLVASLVAAAFLSVAGPFICESGLAFAQDKKEEKKMEQKKEQRKEQQQVHKDGDKAAAAKAPKKKKEGC